MCANVACRPPMCPRVHVSHGRDPVSHGRDPVRHSRDHVQDNRDHVRHSRDPVHRVRVHERRGCDPVCPSPRQCVPLDPDVLRTCDPDAFSC